MTQAGDMLINACTCELPHMHLYRSSRTFKKAFTQNVKEAVYTLLMQVSSG